MSYRESFIGNYFETNKSIIKLLLLSKFSLKKTQNKAKNDDCIVLGNGPSASDTLKDRSFFRQKDVICVNSFSLSEEFVDVKPRYYVFADPGFFSEDTTESICLLRSNVFESIKTKVTWKMTLFLPHNVSRDNKIFGQIAPNDNIEFCFYNITSVLGFPCFRHMVYRKGWGIPPATNVLVPALIHALNLGYKNIYLTGADHSWLENIYLGMDNVLYMKNVHFYENEKIVTHKPVIDAGTKKPTNFKQFLKFYIKVNISYDIIEFFSVKSKQKIINISNNTFIDSFARKMV